MPGFRVAAVGDLHCTRTSRGKIAPLFAQVATMADVLLLCGDLTDYGQVDEARVLVDELGPLRVPIVAVLGNHDLESGHGDAVAGILLAAGILVLDGETCTIGGVGFAGTKGFCGGFGRRQLEPWGEGAIKGFVREAVDEALKLERALSRLRTRQRVAVTHYAPIRETVEGEPREIFAFLGSSRLEDPINRYKCAAAFHGHAHRGIPEAKTAAGVPVYNVAWPVLQRTLGGPNVLRVVELPAVDAASAPSPSSIG